MAAAVLESGAQKSAAEFSDEFFFGVDGIAKSMRLRDAGPIKAPGVTGGVDEFMIEYGGVVVLESELPCVGHLNLIGARQVAGVRMTMLDVRQVVKAVQALLRATNIDRGLGL